MIKFKVLNKLNNVVSFVIESQIGRGDNFNNGRHFTAKNGIELASEACPQVCDEDKLLYLWGSNYQDDSEILKCSISFYNKLETAVKEYNKKFKPVIINENGKIQKKKSPSRKD